MINLCLYVFVAASTVAICGAARMIQEITMEWQREREYDLSLDTPHG